DADLAVAHTDSNDPVPVNTRMRYRFTVTNNGPTSSPDVVVTDDLPGGVKFVSATTGAGSCMFDGVARVVCHLGALASGRSVHLNRTIKPMVARAIHNTVTVTGVNDPVSPNNTDVETTHVM